MCCVRRAQLSDLETCKQYLSKRAVDSDRSKGKLPKPSRRTLRWWLSAEDAVTGYATALAFWGVHATAQTSSDLQALIASAESFGGPGIIVPSRNNAMLRWCLANNLQIVQPLIR